MPPITDSPLGNFPELSRAYAGSFARIGNQTKTAGDEFNTAVGAEAAQAQRKADLEAQARRLQDMTDPSKYQLTQKEDGGYDFFDPEGQQIDIATYAQRTGTRPADVLEKSQNPIDIQYVNDFNNLQKFMDAVVSKDTDAIKQFTDADANLKQYTSGTGGLDRLFQQFKSTYQRYYTPRNVDPRAWGQAPSGVVVRAAKRGDTYGVGDGSGGI
jgi:hypothetical protein